MPLRPAAFSDVFPCHPLPSRARAAGFTLFEVVVALAILGIATGTLGAIFSESLRRVRTAENTALAVMTARSLLEEAAGGTIALSPGDKQGTTEGGLRWTLHVEPYGDMQDRAAWMMQPSIVAATVAWDNKGKGGSVMLKTLLLQTGER